MKTPDDWMTQYNQKQLYTSYEVMDSYGQLTSINQMTKSNRFGIGKNHQTDDHNSSLGQVLTPPQRPVDFARAARRVFRALPESSEQDMVKAKKINRSSKID